VVDIELSINWDSPEKKDARRAGKEEVRGYQALI
jgi:hypothetical protein